MIATRDGDILWDVAEQHLREAAFLWTQWERALVAPSGTLDDVIRGPEERLLAHADGLVLAGEPAVERLLVPALEGYDADNVFAAALALLDGPTKDAFARVMARVEAEPEVAVAVERALALAHRPGIHRELLDATRYLGGKQWSAERLVSAFAVGAMRRRYALGLELAIRSRGEYDVETWGWARDQRESRRDHRPPANPGFAQSFGKMLRE